MIDRAIGIAGVGLAVISPFLPTMFPNIGRKWAWCGFIMGLLLIGGAVGIVFLPSEAQQPPNVTGNCNNFGNNNFNCNTLNLAPPRLTFNEEVQKVVLTIPKDKPLKVTAVGSQSDWDVGTKIGKFLQDSGYNVEMQYTGMLSPPQDHALSLRDAPLERELIVTPALGR